jgi:hypothetical protein
VADFVFNIAKGKAAQLATLPATNDALIVVLLKSTGLESDATLKDYADLAAILAAANDEADFTNYARKTVTASVTVTPDNTNDRVDVDMPDLTWTAAGGATNNTVGKLIVCYDSDTTGGTDSGIVPLTAHDFVATTNSADLVAQLAAAGFFRAA